MNVVEIVENARVERGWSFVQSNRESNICLNNHIFELARTMLNETTISSYETVHMMRNYAAVYII